VTIKVSVVEYPQGTVRAADTTAALKLTLRVPSGEKSYRGRFQGAGTFLVRIPAADMDLPPGKYLLVAESVMRSEMPSVLSAALEVVPEKETDR
jgi:hypothetical protein